MALIPDLAHLPLKEREFRMGCCQPQDALLSRLGKKKLTLGTAEESRHSHVQEELNFP